MPRKTINLTRRAPLPAVHLNGVHAAFDQVDITPTVDVSVGGFSIIALAAANGCCERLRATALVLGEGVERIALVTVDLHAGSRYLTERVASLLPPRCGLGVDRVLLLPSHTHAGPGGYYGVETYDARAASSAGFLESMANDIAGRIAAAITRASDRLDHQPARVGVARAPIWGISANKSMPAFRANGVSLADHTARVSLGAPIPTLETRAHRAIDPRLTVIWCERRAANPADHGPPLGLLAFFGAHPSSVNPLRGLISGDAFSAAARLTTERLWTDGRLWPKRPDDNVARERVPVGFGLSVGADVNLCAPDAHPAQMPSICENDERLDVQRTLGGRLADAALRAVADARTRLTQSLPITVRFRELEPSKQFFQGRPLSDDPQTGHVAAGASEFGRYYLERATTKRVFRAISLQFARSAAQKWPEGSTDPTSSDTRHRPKVLMNQGVLAAIPKGVRQMIRGEMPRRVALRVITLGDWTLATAPFEITVSLGLAIEDALRATGASNMLVTTCTHGYASYATTTAEYDQQHYEGASVIWGRDTGAWLTQALADLANTAPTPAPTGDVTFDVNGKEIADYATRDAPEPNLTATRTHDRIFGAWVARRADRPRFADGAWLVLETDDGAGWRPLMIFGAPADDAHQAVLIERGPTKNRLVTWRFDWPLPAPLRLATHALPTRVRLLPPAFTHGESVTAEVVRAP